MSVVVRIAPSPTGLLHVGNVRTALVNWLFARKHGGKFMFRNDDTDTERSTPEFAAALERDLRWLGLDWDFSARQSDRNDRYGLAIAKLKADGRLYPCYESEEELGLKRKVLISQGRPPVYDRAALRLTEAERQNLEAEGRRPHWRLLLNANEVSWTDLVRGPQHFIGSDLSDPVLVREDGRVLYTLSSCVDDIEFGITHIIRGEDHVTNTAVQIQLFEALGGPVPEFAHLPLLTGAAGEGLSKRIGSLSIASLRDEEGVEPMALASLLAKLGTSDPIEVRATLAELVAEFDMAKISRATPRFDPEELKRLNARLMHLLSFDQVAVRLRALGLDRADEEFWNAVRPNLTRMADARDWWHIAREQVTPTLEGDDLSLTEAAARLLPPEPWTHDTWPQWIDAVKAATGRTGKTLFMPLRRALTGRDHGPELKALLPLIGRDRALARLAGRAG